MDALYSRLCPVIVDFGISDVEASGFISVQLHSELTVSVKLRILVLNNIN